MAVLTGEEVVSSVAINIRAAFTTTELKAIYKDTPLQNIKKPYAFIHQINAEHQNGMRNRARWSFLVDVRVHPQDNQTDVYTWANKIATRLIDAVATITISNQAVKSRSLEWRIEDGVLHLIIGYSFGVQKFSNPGNPMQNLYLNETKISPPEIVNAGEYYEATLVDAHTGSIKINDVIIEGSRVDMSLLSRDSAVWDGVVNGEALIVLKSGDNYLVLDSKRNRLNDAVDGGVF